MATRENANLINGVHTHGQRYEPFGPQNNPDEVKKTREMALPTTQRTKINCCVLISA